MRKDVSLSTSVKIRLACYLAIPAVLYAIPPERVMHGHTVCLFRNLFGTECWGCGMTRALFSLLHLDFTAAWNYNRLVVLVAPLLLYLYVKEVAKTIGELR